MPVTTRSGDCDPERDPPSSNTTTAEMSNSDDRADTATRAVYVMQPEPVIKKFYGTGEAGLAEDFVEEVSQAWSVHPHQTAAWRLGTIKSNIGPVVKAELEVHTDLNKDPAKVLERILEVFGERRSPRQLTRLLHDTCQREGESVRTFSHRLVGIFNILKRRQRALNVGEAEDSILLEHFVESLRDPVLSSTMRERLSDNPTVDFRTLRDRAIQWSGEGTSNGHASSSAVTVDKDLQQENKRLVAQLEKQQKRMDDFMSSMSSMMERLTTGVTPSPLHQGPPRNRGRGPFLCFSCKEPGHFARDCTKNVKPAQR